MNDNYKQIYAISEEHGLLIELYNAYLHRTKYTKNEIRVYEDGICEIDVYDSFGFYKDTSVFSIIDLPMVLPYKWYKDNTGYLSTCIDGNKVRFHRLIFPNELTDHYDNNKLNNTRENLQQVTQAVNIAKITNKCYNPNGVTGIRKTRNNTWNTSIVVNNKTYNKNFKTKGDAILQRYIWELKFWEKNAPQFKKINEEFPTLYKIVIDENISDINLVKERLKK